MAQSIRVISNSFSVKKSTFKFNFETCYINEPFLFGIKIRFAKQNKRLI